LVITSRNINIEDYRRRIEDGKYFLIYNPEGAQPGSPHWNNYVAFAQIKASSGEEICTYTTSSNQLRGFPAHFSGWNGKEAVLNFTSWFQLPQMTYVGSRKWRGIDSDIWVSNKTNCSTKFSASCELLATRGAGTNIPLETISGYPRGPYHNSDDYTSDLWTSFNTTGVPNVNTPFYSDWPINCYNLENAFVFSQYGAYVSTPEVMDSFSVHLAQNGRPLKGAPVNVDIVNSNPQAVRFEFENGQTVKTFQFTHENWMVPVKIQMRHLGLEAYTKFTLVASSGSYAFPHLTTDGYNNVARTTTFSDGVYTCRGKNGRCDDRNLYK